MTTTYCLLNAAPCLSAEAWAAWVQAGFTIVALAIAIAVPAWQFRQTVRRERKREIAEAHRLLSITSELVGRTMQLAVTIQARRNDPLNTETGQQRDEQEQAAAQLSIALRAIPLHLLYNANAAMQVIQALGAISNAGPLIPYHQATITDHVSCGEAYGRPWTNIVGSLTHASEQLDLEVRALKARQRGRGGANERTRRERQCRRGCRRREALLQGGTTTSGGSLALLRLLDGSTVST